MGIWVVRVAEQINTPPGSLCGGLVLPAVSLRHQPETPETYWNTHITRCKV